MGNLIKRQQNIKNEKPLKFCTVKLNAKVVKGVTLQQWKKLLQSLPKIESFQLIILAIARNVIHCI